VEKSTLVLTLDRVMPDDSEVAELFEPFIREADGPLEVEIDIEAEIAAGPPPNLVPPNGVLLLARVDGAPAGLGGVRFLDTEFAEVKSMFVSPPFRGIGLARRILAELETIALARGCRAIRLDTSAYLTPAVALYRAAGYHEVPRYNENLKADLWFERRLEPQQRA
jgi:GNAT superfamily N-acetyltransferase